MVDPTRGGKITSIENSEELASILQKDRKKQSVVRLAGLLGMRTKDNQVKASIPSKDRSIFSQERYKFFLEAPFEISNKCCNVMKKNPAHKYHRDTGRNPITAQMASESRLRTQQWLKSGCNGFNLTIPTANPMSFWNTQDVLLYIKKNNLPICSVYGDVVTEDELEGQKNISDYIDEKELFGADLLTLTTTGCERTGCVLCGFGCHLEKSPNRFEMLKETHPGFYKLLDTIQNNGVTYKEAIDWVNEHGNMNIKY